MKAKDAQLKKLEAAKDDSDKLAHAKTQEVIASETFQYDCLTPCSRRVLDDDLGCPKH